MEAIIKWFKETFSFVDSELLMMIGITIMAIILVKLLFKFLHRFRVLKLLVTVAIIGGVLYMALNYIDTHKDLFSQETRYYVYGKVGFISNSVRTFEIESNKSNLYKGGSGRIIVSVPVGAKILSSETRNEKLELSEIKAGDIVQVYCKESTLNNEDKLTAVKIVRKYKSK